jgi:TP901 family phage tail tape measure protein
MAVEVAEAYVSLVPSGQGFAGKVSDLLGGPLDKAGADAGESLGQGLFGGLAAKAKEAGVGSGTILAGGIAAAGAGLFALGSTFDDAFDSIRVKTGATGDALAGLTDSFKTVFASVPASSGDAATAIGVLNQKLGLTGQPLEGLATQILNLSHVTGTDLSANLKAAVDVFNSFGIAAADQPGKLDELFRASQATGVSVTDLASTMANAGPNLQQLGLSFEQSAGLVGVFGKAGVDVGAVLPALSKSIVTAAKDGKNAGDVFRDTFDAIKAAPDSTSAAAAAIDVFGAKAGPKLAGLIREGKLGFDELAQSISSGGDTINGATADTADLAESFGKFKNQILVGLAPLASEVFDAIGQGFDAILPIVVPLVEAFTSVADSLSLIKIVILPLIGVFVTYKAIMLASAAATKAYEVATVAAGIATKIWSGIQIVFNAVMAANPIGLVVIAIAALVAGVIYAYTHFDTFRSIVDGFWQVIQSVFGWIVDHWPLLLAVLTGPIGIAVLLIIDNWNTIKDVFTATFDWIRDHWQLILAILTGPVGLAVLAITTYWGVIRDTFSDVVGFIGDRVSDIAGFFSGLVGRIAGAVGAAWQVITGTFASAAQSVGGAVDSVVSFFSGLPGRILGALSGLGDLLLGVGQQIGGSLLRGIASALNAGFDFAGAIVGNISGAIRGAINTVVDELNNAIPNHFGWGPVGFDIPANPIPRLAQGGIVTRATLAVIGEGGPEAVIPLGGGGASQGLGGARGPFRDLIINPTTQADAAAIAREVRWAQLTAGV